MISSHGDTVVFGSWIAAGSVFAGKLGTHDKCDGTVNYVRISDTWSAITCSDCFMRVVVPGEADTWTKLRTWAIEWVKPAHAPLLSRAAP
jgi:hypothetical protein